MQEHPTNGKLIAYVRQLDLVYTIYLGLNVHQDKFIGLESIKVH